MSDNASIRLKRNLDQVMKQWEDRANEEVLAAFHLESLALRNSLPELLAQLSDKLSHTIERSTARARRDRAESLRIGQKHGHERAESANYTMDQMITEYHILREVIFDILEEEAPLTLIEREVVISTIEQAVNDAATQFSETLRSIQERLATTLTHDLRGPITSAQLNAEMLLRHPGSDERVKAAAARIAHSMVRLDLMIRDLLDASKLRADEQQSLKFEEFDLGLMAKDFAEEFNFTHDDRFTVIAKTPVMGFWSENGLRRVVENLATNAAKYGAPDTPITLTIEQSEEKVLVSVHNDGPPIPASEQACLFEPFHRTPSARAETGWGIGLTVVKGIAEAHHGSVRIESEDKKGTTFTVELPRDSRVA